MAQAVSSGGNYLFTPRLTYRFRRAGDQGTPIQPEEPQAPNPPDGMYIDYYLHGAPSSALVIEIVGARGTVLRKYSSADKPNYIDPMTQEIAPQWIRQPVIVNIDPGAHRFVWDFTTRHDGGPLAPPGHYTIRLSVDGKTYDRPATLARDPRFNVTDADLQEQFALSTAIDDKMTQIAAAREHAEALLKSGKLSADQTAHLQHDVLGVRGPSNPDGAGVGVAAPDFTSLRFLGQQFGFLFYAVQSADAPPTHDQRLAFSKLSHTLDDTIAKLASIAGPK
jgi:hypothetical protein